MSDEIETPKAYASSEGLKQRLPKRSWEEVVAAIERVEERQSVSAKAGPSLEAQEAVLAGRLQEVIDAWHARRRSAKISDDDNVIPISSRAYIDPSQPSLQAPYEGSGTRPALEPRMAASVSHQDLPATHTPESPPHGHAGGEAPAASEAVLLGTIPTTLGPAEVLLMGRDLRLRIPGSVGRMLPLGEVSYELVPISGEPSLYEARGLSLRAAKDAIGRDRDA